MSKIDREKFENLFGRIWKAPDGNRYIDYCRNGDKPEYLVNIGELVDYFWQFDTISLIIDVQRLIVDFVKETTRPKNIEGFLTPIIYDRINEVGYFADLLEMCVVRDSRLIAAYMEWEKNKKLNDIEP